MKPLHTILSIILFTSGFILSQNIENITTMTLEELLKVPIEIGSSTSSNIFRNPSSISVIDRGTIEKYNFQSISEALNTVSGINILRTTSREEIPTFRNILQDHYPNKVLFLINGVPSWNPVTGEMGAMNRISIDDVERIEILKGPASVVYGTNAFTGAINIILRKEKLDGYSIHLNSRIGDKGGFGAGGNVGISDKKTALYISANSYGEIGDKRYIVGMDTKGVHFEEFLNFRNFTLNLNYGQHSLLLNGYLEDQSKLGVDPAFANALGKPQRLQGYLINYNNEFQISGLTLRNSVGFDWQNRLFPRNSEISIATKMTAWRLFGQIKGLYSFNENLNAELGLDYDYRNNVAYTNLNVVEDITITENNLSGRKIYEFSLFGQLTYSHKIFSIVAGTRYIKNEFFGNNISFRSSAVFNIADNNSLKLIFGQSYRAPSMLEVFYANSQKVLSGLLELKPEKSISFEAAYLTSFYNIFIQALGYYASYENKIFRIDMPYCKLPDGNIGTDKTKQYTNGKKFNAVGFELEAKYQGKFLDAFLNYNYVSGDAGDTVGTNNTSVYNFKYVPKQMVSGGLSVKYGNLFISAVGKFYDKTIGGLDEELKSGILVDLNFGYVHSFNEVTLRHVISVKNALDKIINTPEYVDRALNDVPLNFGRRISYSLFVNL